MKNRNLLAALGLALMSGLSYPASEDYAPSLQGLTKRHKAKPKKNGANPLRGYQARLSHVLSAYSAEQNLAKQANGKSSFKGFRKVRKFIPENHMSVWVNV